jgi:hypothetical protein
LNWRFDAAKDVAHLDARRSNGQFENNKLVGWGDATFEKCWDDVIDIWKNFIGNAKAENSSTYTIAEVTDLWGFYHDPAYKTVVGYDGTPDPERNWDPFYYPENEALYKPLQQQDFGKYQDPNVAERMLYEITGATTGSSYGQLFNEMPQMVGQNLEKGGAVGDAGSRAGTMLKYAIEGLFSAGTLAFINGAHTFVDNHDKPRALHCLAVDTALFLADDPNFSKPEKVKEKQQIANKFFAGHKGDIQKNDIRSEAVAVADAFSKAFQAVLKTPAEKTLYKDAFLPAMQNLALGKSEAENQPNQDSRRAKAWGCKAFDVSLGDVLKEARHLAKGTPLAKQLDAKAGQNIIDRVHAQAIKAGSEKLVKMWELNQAMPGVATLYAGAEYGMTGHEDPSKNTKVGNREPLPHYILDIKPGDKDYNELVEMRQNLFNTIQAITSLSKQKGMSALSGGTPVLAAQPTQDVTAVYHYDDKGSEVLAVVTSFNTQVADPFAPLAGNEGKKKVEHIALPNNIDPKGVFKCKVLNEKTGQYEDKKETFKVEQTADGKYVLVNSKGGPVELDPMSSFFYRENEVQSKKFYHSGYSHSGYRKS